MIQLIDKDTKIPDGIDIVNGNFTEMQEQYDSVTAAVNQAKTYRNLSETFSQVASDESDYAKECADNAKQYADSVADSADQIEKNKQDIATKVTKPDTDGVEGQFLQTNGDGTTQWEDVVTDIKDGSITPEKTSFFTKSDIEYEIVEGLKLNATKIVEDETAFTLFIKIPNKPFAWISVTPSNTTYPFGNSTRTSSSLICNAEKTSLGSYGFTDNNRKLCVIRGDKVGNYEGATYFATSYTLGSEFEIKIGGIGVNNKTEIPLKQTELPLDFIILGKNKISDTNTRVAYVPSTDRWAYYINPCTNFFEIENGKTYYHNSSFIYLAYFDENYNYVSKSGSFSNGTTVELADNIKYAYAYTTDPAYMTEDFWFSDEDLSRKQSTPSKIVNPEYLDIQLDRKHMINWFNNKRVSFIGDSLSAGGTGGFYISYLHDYFGFSKITTSAIGGTFVSGETTAFGAAFWQDERVNAVDLDSDIVFIFGGTNDANNNVALGDSNISNCDTTTFYGAYHVLISKLIYKFYKLDNGYYDSIDYSDVTQVETAKPVQIFLITPPYMLTNESQYNKTPSYCEAVIEIGKQLGCPVCDIRANSDVNIYTAEYYKGYKNGSYDYVHVSPEAHQHWAKVIIGKMLSVEPLN